MQPAGSQITNSVFACMNPHHRVRQAELIKIMVRVRCMTVLNFINDSYNAPLPRRPPSENCMNWSRQKLGAVNNYKVKVHYSYTPDLYNPI